MAGKKQVDQVPGGSAKKGHPISFSSPLLCSFHFQSLTISSLSSFHFNTTKHPRPTQQQPARSFSFDSAGLRVSSLLGVWVTVFLKRFSRFSLPSSLLVLVHSLRGESGSNAETPAKWAEGYKDYPKGYKANVNLHGCRCCVGRSSQSSSGAEASHRVV